MFKLEKAQIYPKGNSVNSGYSPETTPVHPTAPTYQPYYSETAPVHPTAPTYYPETVSVRPSVITCQPYIVNHMEHPPSYAEATSHSYTEETTQQVENM